MKAKEVMGCMRECSLNSTTPNKALRAIRERLTMARTNIGFDWNQTCEHNQHCSSQFMLSVKPCVYSTASKANWSSVLFPDKLFQLHPCKLEFELLGNLSLNMPSTLELSRHAGFSMCHFLVIVYRLFVISLLEWISVRILRDK